MSCPGVASPSSSAGHRAAARARSSCFARRHVRAGVGRHGCPSSESPTPASHLRVTQRRASRTGPAGFTRREVSEPGSLSSPDRHRGDERFGDAKAADRRDSFATQAIASSVTRRTTPLARPAVPAQGIPRRVGRARASEFSEASGSLAAVTRTLGCRPSRYSRPGRPRGRVRRDAANGAAKRGWIRTPSFPRER